MNRSEDRDGESERDGRGVLSEADALAIERACDRLEQSWQAGAPLAIEALLEELPERLRTDALRELIAIETERRIARGDADFEAEYRERFPELTQVPPETMVAGATSGGGDSFSLREPRPGDVIGDYEIVSLLGQGGMGSVYKAYHRPLDRFVAMKCLQPWHSRRPEIAARFEREMKAAARVSHPHVVAVYDAFTEQGRTWLVTECLEGEDLQALVRSQGPLPSDRAVRLLQSAALGLEESHQRGLVHRDVKPANLFLTKDGTLKVLDLGLSRVLAEGEGGEGPLTTSGAFLGTPAYMAPEQAKSARNADRKSDVYSLGCVLYYLLAGKPPFSGTAYDVLLSAATEPAPTLPTEGLTVDRAARLQFLYARMIAKDPGERFGSMREVADAIDELMRLGGGSVETSAGDRKGAASRPASFLAGALALLLLASAGLYGVYAWTRPTGPPEPSPAPVGSTSVLAFDGHSSYVELPDFAVGPDRPATIEAVVRPRRVKTSNVVSWMGPDWFALYLSGDGEWGAGKLVGDESRLLQALEPVSLDRLTHVAATWDGERLRLYVDGVEAPVEPVTFVLAPTEQGLFVGGTPEGRLPAGQADRYFDGAIDAVRLTRGAASIDPGAIDPTAWEADESTLVLLRFDEGTGNATLDEASGENAVIHDASWTTEP